MTIMGQIGPFTSSLKLNSEEMLRVMKILLDEDRKEALLFLKQCLKPQLEQAIRGHLVRSFEGP
jgi:hypothetical protein